MQLLEDWSQSELIRWVAESDYGYPTVLTLHSIGMGLVVGIMLIVNLRVLGLAPGMQLFWLRRFFLFAWIGLVVNAVSGTLLFLANYTAFLHNVAFFTKLALLAAAAVATAMLSKELPEQADSDAVPLTSRARLLAAVSVVLWLGSITAGRIIGYTSMPE